MRRSTTALLVAIGWRGRAGRTPVGALARGRSTERGTRIEPQARTTGSFSLVVKGELGPQATPSASRVTAFSSHSTPVLAGDGVSEILLAKFLLQSRALSHLCIHRGVVAAVAVSVSDPPVDRDGGHR